MLCSQREKFRYSLYVPVRVLHPGMTEVGTQSGHALGDVDSAPVPFHQSAGRERVAEVLQPGTASQALSLEHRSEPNLAAQQSEGCPG